MVKKAHHRGFDHMERKLNSMGRRKLLGALCFVPYSEGFVADKVLELNQVKMTGVQRKSVTKMVNAHALTDLSNEPKYAKFINSIWALKKEFHRKPYAFTNLDGVAVICYAATKMREHIEKGGYNTENRQEEYLADGVALWWKGGEDWNDLIDHYYSFNDEDLGSSTEA